jgi:putative peptidoglycan lipid II flippase
VTTPTDGRPEPAPGEARAAARVGAGILFSRVFGFIRDRVVAHYFGSSDFADAWRAGLRLPNVVQNLLGEGTLSASMIPVYAEMIEEGREEDAARFAGAALGILTAVAAAVTLIGWAVAPWLVTLFFWEWDPTKQALTVSVVRILFPMTGVLVVSAWALGILNSHRRFFVSYVAPVLWNLAMITAVLGGALYFGLEPQSRDLLLALAWGALAGSGLHVAFQVPFLAGYVRGMRVSLGRDVDGVEEAVTNFWPVLAARGVVNLSGWIDMILAGRLRDGALAVMGYAQTIYVLPISLFGMSVAASELPELSRMRGEAEHTISERVARSLRRVMYFLIPSTIACLFLGDILVAALYETGEFAAAQSLVTWSVLAAYAVGLPASASSRLLSSAFYALRDTKTPARIAYVRVAVSALVGIGLMIPADRLGFEPLRLGAAGLALGASAGAWLEYVLLRRALGRAIGGHGPGSAPLVRTALAASLGAAAAIGVQLLVPPAHPIVVAAETVLPFGVVYVAVAALLGERLELRRSATG